MIPTHKHTTERWQTFMTLTCVLVILLAYILPQENAAALVTVIIGYVVTVLIFDHWLANPINDKA